MDIETKYDVGDEVFVITYEIRSVTITNILFKAWRTSTGLKTKCEYSYTSRITGESNTVKEELIYGSKFEAAKSWLTKQDLEPNDVIQSVFGNNR